MPSEQIRRVAETGLAIALAVVLHTVLVYQAPFGGRITAGSMVPIFLVALRWGPRWGFLAGAASSVLIFFFIEHFYAHPVQWLLDYPVAWGAIGVAGAFRRAPILGIVIGGTLRLAFHFLAGVVYWAANTPQGWHPWVYSAAYNGGYMLPEIAISVVLTLLLLRAMVRLTPAMR